MGKLGVFLLLFDTKTQREDPGPGFKRSRVQRAITTDSSTADLPGCNSLSQTYFYL